MPTTIRPYTQQHTHTRTHTDTYIRNVRKLIFHCVPVHMSERKKPGRLRLVIAEIFMTDGVIKRRTEIKTDAHVSYLAPDLNIRYRNTAHCFVVKIETKGDCYLIYTSLNLPVINFNNLLFYMFLFYFSIKEY